MHRVVKLSLTAVLLWGVSRPAAAYFELSGVFVADDRCQAMDSIRRETNPGGILTVPGQSYNVRGLNKEEGDFVHVDVPGAVPPTRWVNLGCGELFRQAEEPDPPRPPGTGDPISGFLPFFDEDDRPNDPTPRPPRLGSFDQAMLKVCGNWGARPLQTDFRTMLDEPALAGDVGRILQALGASVLGPPREPKRFKDELATAWFAEDGFRHIFCGEPSGGTIGGLHFHGRYLQMQQEGWGGMATRCDNTEIAPPIYTFGVSYRGPRGQRRTACPKGYALNLDAADILIEATKALKLMLPRTSGKAMCLHRIAKPNDPPYLAVFVIKSGAVRTFYPDASPRCDRDRPAENCMCGG
jgi:Bacterial EndoU nuclease